MNVRVAFLQRIKTYLESVDYFDSIIGKYAKSPDFFFIQIGANDGIHADPICNYVRKYNWKGILIEPQLNYFNKLKINYKDMPDLIFENIAIGLKNEEVNLYKVAEYEQENWHNLVASIDSSRGDLAWLRNEKQLEIEKVQSLPFSELLSKYSVQKIDLLQIDTEGYEHKLFCSKDFFSIKAKVIHYEHKHLTYAEQTDCIAILNNLNYKVYLEKYDTIAVLIS